ncbi:MAG: ATP-binding protein [Acidobacteria bacterium]|nr:ATP-binding protein [Acidobacteriota bacterium]
MKQAEQSIANTQSAVISILSCQSDDTALVEAPTQSDHTALVEEPTEFDGPQITDATSKETTMAKASAEQVPLIKVDTALLSLRASNFDTPAAVGEPIDNSIQANAHNIRIRLLEGERRVGKRQKSTPIVNQIAFADDGDGMDEKTLQNALVLGYSTRYNNRSGMGRFGVGATLAGISQAQHLGIYTRATNQGSYLYTYIDLEDIATGKQTAMPKPEARDIPKEFSDLMSNGSGTLVVWSKCDRLVQGDDGTVHDLNEVRSDLVEWIARTYRYFLDGGLRIELDGKPVEPHDPLYLMTIPRFQDDPKAEILIDDKFEWTIPSDPSRTSIVRVRMTLLPKEWRLLRGWGNPTNSQTRERKIHKNEGISILRAKREIFYGILPKFYPSAVQDIDRWHGIEIMFEPELDECFRVRNVKKGAEPVEGLRARLKEFLDATVNNARKRIKNTYTEEENKRHTQQGIHDSAEKITTEVEEVSPKARSGQATTPEQRESVIDEVVAAAVKAAAADENAPTPSAVAIKERIRTLPFSIVDTQWPGKEFIEIEHLGQNTIVKLNKRHPFFTRIYAPVLKAAGMQSHNIENGSKATKVTEEELTAIARTVQVGLDLLIMAYAKAESMHPDPDSQYGDLRTQWGLFLYNMIQRIDGNAA